MSGQLSFFSNSNKSKSNAAIVNVASVPQVSPFRYPGGKTWLVPSVRHWLNSLPSLPHRFVEPFAGGAIIGLTVAFEKLSQEVVLVELDEQVAAVWQTIINLGEGEWLAQRIKSFELTSLSVAEILKETGESIPEQAFQTILKNRVNRGGILAKGAGLIKSGENGKGLRSRWYPSTLAKRIRSIDSIRSRLQFIQTDGLKVIRQYADELSTVFFVDPPYTAGDGKRAGSRLYNHWTIDHIQLFELMGSVKGDFLMTYDNDPYVVDLASHHGFDVEPVAMKNTHHAKLTELLIGKDLSYLR